MKRTLISLVLLLGLMLPAATNVMAQPLAGDQTFVSEVTGEEVDLGSSGNITFIEDNYDLRETVSFQEEYIWFTYGWSNFQLVLIGGPNEAADYHDITLGNMEVFYDSWDLVGEDITDDHSWFLGLAELDGMPLVVYYEFELDAFGEIDLAVMQFTDISAFQNDMEVVQDEVTIGGNALLPNTDAGELAILAGGDSSTPEVSPEADDETDTDTTGTPSGDAVDTDEDDAGAERSRTSRGGTDATVDTDGAEDEEESDTGRSRTSRGGSTETDTEETSNTTETDSGSRVGRAGNSLNAPSDGEDEDSTPVSGADWDALGLISDTEWESPTYGNVVTWDAATWEFPLDFEQAIVVNEDPPYDVITLQTTDGLGYVYLTVDQAYDSTPSSLIEYWTSEDYAAQIPGGISVLETGTTMNSATMVYESTNSIDQPLVVVMEATFLDDGQVVFSQISAAPDTIHEVYEQYADGVEVDGAPLELTFTVEDIRDISGN